MPFALITAGLLMVITAANNTHVQLANQLKTDGTAFTKWMVAIGMVGAAGYVSDLQTLSRTFLVLILLAMILSNSQSGKGVIGNFQDAIDQGPAAVSPSSSGTASPSPALSQAQTSADTLNSWFANPSIAGFKTFLFGAPAQGSTP